MEEKPTSTNFGESFRFCIQRNYSEGLLTQWEEEFPQGLDQFGVTEEQFQFTIRQLNRLFKEAEEYHCTTCIEASLACLSFYSLYLCLPGQYKRGKRRIELFIESQNNNEYSPNVKWLNPYRNGLLNIIIVATK
mmetsp:Transcript_134303/g.199880  ORF Transcript_134303/g.199880 Transcript_134303/m.199880 type:complete len:134 (-) Transcript_134303:8-409(-)